MEFLVEFDVHIPEGTPEAEVGGPWMDVTVTPLEPHANDPLTREPACACPTHG